MTNGTGSLTLALFGEPRVHVDGTPVACSSKKALGLFCYLAASGRRHTRRELARLFWGGRDDEAARTSLRTALQRLPAPLAERIRADRESIELAGDVDLDTRRFAALASRDDVESLAEAARLYAGDLLKDLDLDAAPEFDDWLHRERVRYRQAAQSVFDRLIARHRERALQDAARASVEREAAMAAARRWIELDPGAEAAHRWLMQLYFESGQRDAALAQYDVCQRELAVVHGRGPGEQTRALLDTIRDADAGRAASAAAGAPPVRAADAASAATEKATLHAPELAGTSFVGRVDELAALDALLADPGCRLLTLHAMGGAGKSRLAFALAGQVAARFANGATWVALEGVPSAAELPIAIARALGIELAPAQDPVAALCAALRAQERLLVLDNLEHLLGASGPAVDCLLALLREAPRLRLLVTSRETLGVQEEWVYEVPGLGCPSPDGAAPAAVADYPAAELFVQRARQAYLGFSAQAEWPHIVRICRLVEGLPLAIELAAAWVRTIPCGDLAHAIESDLAQLSARHRNRPARHHSLDAVVRTSWSLLAREQQQALAQLSLFVAGFTQEAAQQVAGASLRVVSSLVDKALVQRREAGRLGLHPLVRQFAAAQLDGRGDLARQAKHRYRGYYAELLQRTRARLDTADEIDADAVLNAELPNLLAAAAAWLDDDASSTDAADVVASTAEPLLRVLMGRGMLRDVRDRATRMLERPRPLPPAARAMALAYRGRATGMLGDWDAGRADLHAAIDVARRHDLRYALAYAWVYDTAGLYHMRRLQEVLGRVDNIGPELAALDEPALAMRVHYMAAMALDELGRSDDAMARSREALACATATESPMAIATVKSGMVAVLATQGRLAEAEALARECAPLFERLGRRHDLARMLGTLATLVLWQGRSDDLPAALRDAERALQICSDMGYTDMQAVAANTLGELLAVLGRQDEARAMFERAAAIGSLTTASEARHLLGTMEISLGRFAEARALARTLVEAARGTELALVRHCAILLAATIASREPRGADAACRWLGAVRADAASNHALRRAVEQVAATLGDAAAGGAPPTQQQALREIDDWLARR